MQEFSFVSGAADNIKKWQTRDGAFLKNLRGHNTIINSMDVNEDGVLVTGGDNGTIHFWDYSSGYNFQKIETTVQPGSLDCESGIYASTFDFSGRSVMFEYFMIITSPLSRLITGEADKTIKIWREDAEATEESHPIDEKSWVRECLTSSRRA